MISTERIKRRCAAYLQILRSIVRHSRDEEAPKGIWLPSAGEITCRMPISNRCVSSICKLHFPNTGKR